MNVRIHRTAESLSQEWAQDVAAAIARKPDLVLGLSAGRTPVPLYRELGAISRTRPLDWSRVRTFNLDEFVTEPAASPQPFQQFMQDQLLALVNVSPSNVDCPNGRALDLETECDRYERAIAGAGGLDLVLLGIGANGHIGFNEPGSSSSARTHVVTLAEETRAANAWLFGDRIDLVPARALSMGMATILGARSIVLVATGDEKAPAVAGLLNGEISMALPASFLRRHPDVTVMLDERAAAAIAT